MIKKHLTILLTIMILTSLLLCGCESVDSIYTMFSDSYELSDDELTALSEGKLALNLEDNSSSDFDTTPGTMNIDNIGSKTKSFVYSLVSGLCTWTKKYGIYVAVISAFVGIVIMRLARKSINIRRKALFILVIGIPILIFVLMYGSAFLADAMINK